MDQSRTHQQFLDRISFIKTNRKTKAINRELISREKILLYHISINCDLYNLHNAYIHNTYIRANARTHTRTQYFDLFQRKSVINQCVISDFRGETNG